ncbi:MAG: hypothetical protein ACXVEE_42220 [Polyangiales bacterium]
MEMAIDDKKQRKIQAETPEHDEQPLEHVKTLAPETPEDPDKPTTERESFPYFCVPGGPIL